MEGLSNQTDNATLWHRYGTTSAIFHEFAPTYVTLDRAVTPVWIVLGLILNPVSAYIWLERRIRRNNSSAIYLATLSICDFVFLVLQIFVELRFWGIYTYDEKIWCKVFYLAYYWPQYLSPLLVLGFTVERYIAVCHPFAKERFCTVSRAINTVIFIQVISFALACVQPFAWEYAEVTSECGTSEKVENFYQWWTFFTEILVFGVVPLAVLIFNIRVLLEIKRITNESGSMLPYQPNQSSNTAASTITLVSVSFYLILSLLPVTIVYIMGFLIHYGEINLTDDQVRADPTWTRFFNFMIARKFVEELCLSHYCFYFFIYIATGMQFRNAFVRLICQHKACQSRRNANVKYNVVHANGDGTTCVTAI